jgi:spore coat protein U-like protein
MRLGISRFVSAALAGSAALVSQGAWAQSSEVQVTLLNRLSLAKTADLEFGTLISSATAGTVTVSTTGVRTVTGGVTPAGGTVSAAGFAGFGRRTQQIVILFGAPSILIKRVGGTQTMAVNNFTVNPVGGSGLTQLGGSGRHRISSATGLFDFTVGARLNVGANAVPGDYVGTFNVTVNYQ